MNPQNDPDDQAFFIDDDDDDDDKDNEMSKQTDKKIKKSKKKTRIKNSQTFPSCLLLTRFNFFFYIYVQNLSINVVDDYDNNKST